MQFQSKKALKSEVRKLKAELRKAQSQLTKAKESLATSNSFQQFYYGKYELYKQRCEKLEKENTNLKRKIKQLETEKKAVKAVQIAHQNYNRKEA